MQQILSDLYLMGGLQGLLLAALILRKSGNKTNQVILIAYMTTYSLLLLSQGVLIHPNLKTLYINNPHLIGVLTPFIFVFAPLHFLYVKYTLREAGAFTKKDLLHFIPYALALILLFPEFFQTAEYKLSQIRSYDPSNTSPGIHTLAVFLQGILYMIYSFLFIKRELDGENISHKSQSYFQLKWLKQLTSAMGFVWLAFGIALTLLLFGVNVPIGLDNFMLVSMTLFIYTTGYIGLKNPVLIVNFPEMIKSKRKYEKTSLDKTQYDDYLARVTEEIIEEKMYLDNEISLNRLAKKLEIPTNHLSQVINSAFEKNFNDFINYYRILEAEKLMSDPSFNNYTILALGMKVGFNSPSSFNEAFKKVKGLSPAKFKKQFLQES